MTNLNLVDAMPTLSSAAAAVLDASNLHPCRDSCLILAAALRAAANHLTDATSSHTLYAIADELEGIAYGTYRCNLEAQ